MLPINPRDLQRQLRQLRRMGVSINAVEGVKRVILEFEDKDLVLEQPQVMVMSFAGQKVYQIVAARETEVRAEEKPQVSEVEAPVEAGVTVSDEDVKFVAEYAGVSEEEARRALIKARGDIAEALMILQEKQGKG